MDKKEVLKEIMKTLSQGKDASELIRLFINHFDTLSHEEIAEVAEELEQQGYFMQPEHHIFLERQIHKLVEAKVKSKIGEDLPAWHPVRTFIEENKVIRQLVERAKELMLNPDSFETLYSDWLLIVKQFKQLNLHYLRKENQLFPYLEKYGFTHPSTVMWSVHDRIREMVKEFAKAVEQKDKKRAFEILPELIQEVADMTVKEERVLLPTALKLLKPEDWVQIRLGEDEIGWMIAPPPKPGEDRKVVEEQEEKIEQNFNISDADSLLGAITLETGALTPQQINLIFKHLPVDVTFVDENDRVRYYNKGEDRLFPRSPGIIGRAVEKCHPPKSIHIVKKILEAFRKGERDKAEFWINYRGRFVYIQYFAVRDNSGRYRGVLEVTFDATRVRMLEGEKRLLDWN